MNEIDAIRARHAVVEARREWAHTVAPEDAAAAHADRGALLEGLEDLERERDEALTFLRRTARTGGSIVSSAAMTPTQIAVAMAADRMLVMSDGCGFVYVPDGNPAHAVAERDEALAKLARNEAAGPAVLKADHYPDCSRDAFTECDCSARPIDEAYREQHARDVAIVEAVDDDVLGAASSIDDIDASDADIGRAIKAFILRALKGIPAQPADEQNTSAAAAERLLAVEEEADRQASLRAHEETADDWIYVCDLEFEE